MTNTRLVAYALIAIGTVALLSRLTGDAGWLWIGLVAAAFLVAYRREHLYAFLVLGSVLMGIAVGILLEGSWHWPGTFLVSLGAGIAAIDLAERRAGRWPRVLGLGLIALGVVSGLLEAGVLTTSAFAVLMIAAGAVLVLQGRRGTAATPSGARPDSGTTATDAATAGGAEAPSLTAEAAAVGGEPGALRAALDAWRTRTARTEGRSEALVLNDATLDAIVRERPRDLDALARVRGVGPVKLERYGSALLELVASDG